MFQAFKEEILQYCVPHFVMKSVTYLKRLYIAVKQLYSNMKGHSND